MSNKFSFSEYKKIVSYFLAELQITKIENINKRSKKFFFIRHDVEFSVLRAFDLAKFECENLGIKTNYFFQIKNNCYNLISNKNIELVKKIQKMGHNIGLHFNYSGSNNQNKIKKELFNQFNILNKYFKNIKNYFTPHRPNQMKSLQKSEIRGLINLYTRNYFTPYDKIKNNYNLPLYVADSRGKWKFIHPLNINLKKHKKIQVNFHPDLWSKKGLINKKNYDDLIDANSKIFKQSLLDETDYLRKIVKI